ncbi:kinesin 5 [Monocercomonoides exilis]|uniref:kinesin 5 n=1 Tax=Monocercomonoides exilis TaxID=2049356 RepID=UPI00355A7105|nr:kinesin 5 [Monocercomonoides exilis]|eukprot:MONOS_13807.1-p1 / transcript=MONOS_13807.1 / gene=MONOS_13807 / organism=Monocercomonoides_exilis_PA203 / gene_product=kinesin 5 / transcript_product=kinesin 5 / location=Mono_scaffold00886:19137-22152(+) / protein_length=981 / sequence_SO=supercontig / SO=protein_coding / is_pseudo=false
MGQHQNSQNLMKYSFDRVYPPETKQEQVFDEIIKHIIDESLQGFNCTVFAYGQTGSGKTYTMEGKHTETGELSGEEIGIIPRSMHRIFSLLDQACPDGVISGSDIDGCTELDSTHQISRPQSRASSRLCSPVPTSPVLSPSSRPSSPSLFNATTTNANSLPSSSSASASAASSSFGSSRSLSPNPLPPLSPPLPLSPSSGFPGSAPISPFPISPSSSGLDPFDSAFFSLPQPSPSEVKAVFGSDQVLCWKVSVSNVEIYNENLRDLLSGGDVDKEEEKKKEKDGDKRTGWQNTATNSTSATSSASSSRPTSPSTSSSGHSSAPFQASSSNSSSSSPSSSSARFPHSKKLSIVQGRDNSVFIQGVKEEVVCSPAEAIFWMKEGEKRRISAETALNQRSSRSHSIFIVSIAIKKRRRGRKHGAGGGISTPTRSEAAGEDELFAADEFAGGEEEGGAGEVEEIIHGKLNLVDLAGSECVGRTKAEKQQQKEAGYINQSLLTLGKVIDALRTKSEHIPYRESHLTRLLQNSLGGDGKTAMIATIDLSEANRENTKSTLDFATRTKSVQNKPKINVALSSQTKLDAMKKKIATLEKQVRMMVSKEGVRVEQEVWEKMKQREKEVEEKLKVLERENEEKGREVKTLTVELEKERVRSTELERTFEFALSEEKAKRFEQERRIESAELKMKDFAAQLAQQAQMQEKVQTTVKYLTWVQNTLVPQFFVPLMKLVNERKDNDCEDKSSEFEKKIEKVNEQFDTIMGHINKMAEEMNHLAKEHRQLQDAMEGIKEKKQKATKAITDQLSLIDAQMSRLKELIEAKSKEEEEEETSLSEGFSELSKIMEDARHHVSNSKTDVNDSSNEAVSSDVTLIDQVCQSQQETRGILTSLGQLIEENQATNKIIQIVESTFDSSSDKLPVFEGKTEADKDDEECNANIKTKESKIEHIVSAFKYDTNMALETLKQFENQQNQISLVTESIRSNENELT